VVLAMLAMVDKWGRWPNGHR